MRKSLAIQGGKPTIDYKLPYRNLFDKHVLEQVQRVFEASWECERDFSYNADFEREYTDAFSMFQGGGFTDAVSSGTAALFLALTALRLPKDSSVLFSPVTDPGGITPAIQLGYKCILADSEGDSFNTNLEQVSRRVSKDTSALVLTHVGGVPIDMEPIAAFAKENNLLVIEDCSQAHGASVDGKKVGTFGDVAIFSTMFAKNHATGGCGGLVYSQSEELIEKVRALADRGKPFADPNFLPKDPSTFKFVGLNFNQDELSCAIGIETLKRLPETIKRRGEILNQVRFFTEQSSLYSIKHLPSSFKVSPFFISVEVALEKVSCSKSDLTAAIAAEGVPINPDYRYVISEWPWAKPHLQAPYETTNATSYREKSFNILFNEKFSDSDVELMLEALEKVEKAYKI